METISYTIQSRRLSLAKTWRKADAKYGNLIISNVGAISTTHIPSLCFYFLLVNSGCTPDIPAGENTVARYSEHMLASWPRPCLRDVGRVAAGLREGAAGLFCCVRTGLGMHD
ncbi:hypothetical protein ACJJTC_003202 [Scirpophaga incertulas]